jgi:hypothetical protein
MDKTLNANDYQALLNVLNRTTVKGMDEAQALLALADKLVAALKAETSQGPAPEL